MRWSRDAEARLEAFLEGERARLAADTDAAGSDATEVLEDLRSHVHESLHRRGLELVTLTELDGVLAAIRAEPRSPRVDAAPAARAESEEPLVLPVMPKPRLPKRLGTRSATALWLFGVALPLAAIAVELSTRMCAMHLFDPLPTLWHGILAALVPLGFGLFALQLEVDEPVPRVVGGLFGVGVGIVGYYSIVFLPVLPLSIVATVFGVGVLGLSPYAALLTALIAWRTGSSLEERRGRTRVPWARTGFAIGLLALPLASAPGLLTKSWMSGATSDDAAVRARALESLRRFGNESILLEACYYGDHRGNEPLLEMLGASGRFSSGDAREVYYRVYGRPFNAVPPPSSSLRAGFLPSPESLWFADDPDVAGTEVGAALAHVALASGRLDAKLEVDAAVAYLEWTLEFRNGDVDEHEARCEVLLPPGGVVSRLTLWVDGEEREAAFDARGKTREAYQSVVRRRRDPVLVTTSGPDRVLVQCYPVPPRGGTMKIRLGITAPLALPEPDRVALELPAIVERNFAVAPELAHDLWLFADGAFHADPLLDGLSIAGGDGGDALRGAVTDRALARGPRAVFARRDGAVTTTWTEDERGEPGWGVLQQLAPPDVAAAETVVLCVDGSVGLEAVASQVAFALPYLSPRAELAVVVAGDVPEILLPAATASPEALSRAAADLTGYAYRGGRDAVPALETALDIASGAREALVVWVHGPQPEILDGLGAVEQHLEFGRLRVVAVEGAAGPNEVLRGLADAHGVERLPRWGRLGEDLARLFGRTDEQAPAPRFARTRVPESALESVGDDVVSASAHVARLWAAEEVRRLRRARGDGFLEAAVELSSVYQLVTPVSGAVVLESQAQFEAAGLDPVDAASVPSVPEPELVLLLLVAGAAFVFTVSRGRVA